MKRSNSKKCNKAALYVRLSREDALEGDSNSVLNQKKLLEKAAREKGYEPVFYVDDGITGTTAKRDAYQEMISDIDAGKIAAVFVKDLSRLARDYLESGLFIEQCVHFKDVRVIAISDGLDSSNGFDLIMVALKNVMNEAYAQDISNKCRLANSTKSASGIPLGKPPYGYMKDPDNPDYWVVDDDAAPIVERIYNEYLDGKGTAQIAADLESDGVKTPLNYAISKGFKKGGRRSEKPSKWNSSTVIKLLNTQEYCGDVINCKTYTKNYKNKKQFKNENPLVFKDVHQPIIEREKWEKVRKIRSEIRKRKTTTGKCNIFCGLLVCPDCGGKLGYHFNQGNHSIQYFNCIAYNKRHRECDTSHYVRADFLEQVVLSEIKRLTKFVSKYSDTFENAIREFAQDRTELEVKRREKRLKDAQKRSADIDVIIKKLYEDNMLGEVQDKRFSVLTEQYEQEQAELSDSINALVDEIRQESEKEQEIDVFVAAVKKYSRVRKLTQEMLYDLVDRIEVHDAQKIDGITVQHIDIYYNCIGSIEIPDVLPIPQTVVQINTRQGVTLRYGT